MANEEITGRAGVAPPPGAPMEASQPLTADAGTIIDADGIAHRPIDKARQNERQLQPLVYKDSVAQAAAELAGTATPGVVQAPKAVQAAVVPVPAAPVIPPTIRPADPTQPAASNSDSPSRGIPGTAFSPHRAKDPLRVEGGFGAGAGEYFALDGTEMKVCVQQILEELLAQAENDHRIVQMAALTTAAVTVRLVLLADTEDQTVTIEQTGDNADGDLVQAVVRACDTLHAGLATDMRFQMAATYPQYGCLLTLTVKAHAADPGFTIQKHRRELDPSGEVETPPDALREELGLPIPGREVVMAGALGALSSDTRR